MTLTAAEVAERYGGSRPGFELVAAEEVGLPFYRLTLEVVIQQRSPLPTIDEFVFHAVASGLSQFEDVVGLLGLEKVLVEQAVVEQSHRDHLDYVWDPAAGERRLRLTPLGRDALENATLLRERRAIDIGFDRLLWVPTGRRLSHLIRLKQAADLGFLEVPPIRKKTLTVLDLDLEATKRSIQELSVRALEEIEVLALTNVTNYKHVMPAIALIYVANDGSSTQVAFAIDGRISSEHERVFAEMGGPERCGFIVQGLPHEAQRPLIPASLEDEGLSREQVQMLQSREAKLSQNLEDTRTATAALDGERDSKPISINEGELVSAVADLANQLDSSPARAIQTYEHMALLDSALADSKRRLLIVSPSVRTPGVDQNFIARLERLCRNGVAVHIGWGLSSDDDAEQSDPKALQSLQRLAEKYQNFTPGLIRETSQGVLIWDSTLVVTSFSWLCFHDSDRRSYRQEDGALIRDLTYVDDQYNALRQQIEAASNRKLRS